MHVFVAYFDPGKTSFVLSYVAETWKTTAWAVEQKKPLAKMEYQRIFNSLVNQAYMAR